MRTKIIEGENKRAAMLEFIQCFQDSKKYPPSIRDFVKAGISPSTSVISYHLRMLRKQNKIDYVDGLARSIHLIGSYSSTVSNSPTPQAK